MVSRNNASGRLLQPALLGTIDADIALYRIGAPELSEEAADNIHRALRTRHCWQRIFMKREDGTSESVSLEKQNHVMSCVLVVLIAGVRRNLRGKQRLALVGPSHKPSRSPPRQQIFL